MKKNKVLLFYNPNAGNGLFSNSLDLIIERFQKKKLFVVPIRADYKEGHCSRRRWNHKYSGKFDDKE